jgi:hypothetical protein
MSHKKQNSKRRRKGNVKAAVIDRNWTMVYFGLPYEVLTQRKQAS